MYHRLAMVAVPPAERLAANAQHQGYEETYDLIDHEEEDGRDRDHHEHHCGGDHRLAPRGPRDLLGLVAHLLHELEEVGSHSDYGRRTGAVVPELRSSPCTREFIFCPLSSVLCPLFLAGVEGLEPPTPGFGDRCSSQLSYTPSSDDGGQMTVDRS